MHPMWRNLTLERLTCTRCQAYPLCHRCHRKHGGEPPWRSAMARGSRYGEDPAQLFGARRGSGDVSTRQPGAVGRWWQRQVGFYRMHIRALEEGDALILAQGRAGEGGLPQGPFNRPVKGHSHDIRAPNSRRYHRRACRGLSGKTTISARARGHFSAGTEPLAWGPPCTQLAPPAPRGLGKLGTRTLEGREGCHWYTQTP